MTLFAPFMGDILSLSVSISRTRERNSKRRNVTEKITKEIKTKKATTITMIQGILAIDIMNIETATIITRKIVLMEG